jgi:hypothetical protein
MEMTTEQVRVMAQALGLDIPAADLNNVTLRLTALLTAMEGMERELSTEMDKTEPIPPVYQHEEQ